MKYVHTLAIVGGSTNARQDKLVAALKGNVANVIGAGAGLSVVTAVAFANELPTGYTVQVTPNQDAVAFVTNKTSTGFDVTLSPRLAANTLAAGTFDVTVLG